VVWLSFARGDRRLLTYPHKSSHDLVDHLTQINKPQ
jgi:hypothetical protein